jgi:non-canonical purine NTP pyrophosphatase (RdgB/HAM1 family)
MRSVVYITGNLNKANQLANYLGCPITHHAIELNEIQSLDLEEVVRHKALEAYALVQHPVLVEDVSLTFNALGKLPGTFIRWFSQEMKNEGLCRLLDGKERGATARAMFSYFDGSDEKYFEGSMQGTIAEHPAGKNGYGWDPIFIPEGYSQTRAELSPDDYQKTFLAIKPVLSLKEYLEEI